MRKLLVLITLPFLLDAAVAYALAASPVSDTEGARGTSIFFDWEQAELSAGARLKLAQAATAAGHGQPRILTIEAADGHGIRPAYAAALTRARLGNITRALRQDGVLPAQIVPENREAVWLKPDRRALPHAEPAQW